MAFPFILSDHKGLSFLFLVFQLQSVHPQISKYIAAIIIRPLPHFCTWKKNKLANDKVVSHEIVCAGASRLLLLLLGRHHVMRIRHSDWHLTHMALWDAASPVVVRIGTIHGIETGVVGLIGGGIVDHMLLLLLLFQHLELWVWRGGGDRGARGERWRVRRKRGSWGGSLPVIVQITRTNISIDKIVIIIRPCLHCVSKKIETYNETFGLGDWALAGHSGPPWPLLNLALAFWNQTWSTRFDRPVFWDSCFRSLASGLWLSSK